MYSYLINYLWIFFFLCIAKPFELITVGISFIFMPFLKCKIYNFRFFNSAPYKCTVHPFKCLPDLCSGQPTFHGNYLQCVYTLLKKILDKFKFQWTFFLTSSGNCLPLFKFFKWNFFLFSVHYHAIAIFSLMFAFFSILLLYISDTVGLMVNFYNSDSWQIIYSAGNSVKQRGSVANLDPHNFSGSPSNCFSSDRNLNLAH